MSLIKNLFLVSAFVLLLSPPSLLADYVDSSSSAGAFQLASGSRAAAIYVDGQDYPGVIRAAGDLAEDIGKVTGVHPQVIRAAQDFHSPPILIGTIGKSAIIDRLAKDGKIDIAEISGKWESFIVQVVPNPLPGIDSALVIAGSDKRGTIYGIYDLSEEMGVSPWYWWADVPIAHRDALFVRAGRYVQGPPKVKYRGIFINDEEPAFGPWAREKFGGINSKMYTHMFELILRLKGNYLWPAMWGKSFTQDDPESPRLADEYGIVMGTSHHEPMMRAQQEWTKGHKGPWNYATNEAELQTFWRAGVQRNKSYEDLITIGMRGDGDKPMVENGDMKANTALLERIVADQRKMIAEIMNPDVTKVPQLWALYKEVEDYYEQGMRVPDDVTLLWCDDNWGNIRRLPTAEERNRSGGAGIYYHFDYVGDPRDYKWLNTNPLPKIWEQMNLAHQYGADRIWIVNVGDLKPMELPISFFLKMAWDPDAINQDQIADFTRQWAQQQFGPEHAGEIADILSKYAKYNGWRKPELLEPSTFSLINYQEADRVLDDWNAITKKAGQIYAGLPAAQRDAFYQLVLYPTKASASVVEMYIAAGRNHLYARQHRASANIQAQSVRALFKQDQDLSDEYNHQLAGGKWNHMMDQTRIGYTSWQDPKKNVMPAVQEIQIPEAAEMGVAIEGSESSWPGEKTEARLPDFDSINQQKYPIDIFNRGSKTFEFAATADQPWIQLSDASGTIDGDRRIRASIDWPAAPVGEANGTITIAQKDGATVSILLRSVRSSELTRQSLNALGGLSGPTAFAAESVSANIPAGGVRWMNIPDYGRGASGMSIFPVNTVSLTPPQSPHLEYRVYIPQAGPVQVDAIVAPTLNFVPGRGLRFAVSFDDQQPQVVDILGESDPSLNKWRDSVRDNARKASSTQTVSSPGVHTLKIWMVDPAVVLEKLIIHQGQVRPSYFGPPEQRGG